MCSDGTAGQAYIYSNLDSESWTLLKTLRSERGEHSYFGYSVSLQGSSLIVGAVGNQPEYFQTPRHGA